MGEDTILPTSIAAAKASCDSNRLLIESHIAAMRERGRVFNESLKERHEAKLQNFQKERKERGLASSFEKNCAAKDKAVEAARKAATAGKNTVKDFKPELESPGIAGLK